MEYVGRTYEEEVLSAERLSLWIHFNINIRATNMTTVTVSYFITSILSLITSVLVLSASSHSALTTVVFSIFE
jgi:hypothetical protein